jgi:hypothetical protein
MAQTYKQLADRVKGNLGNPTSGFDYTTVYTDFEEMLEYDIPNKLGGPYAEGSDDVTLGGSGAPSSGRYSVPPRLSSVSTPILLDDGAYVIYGKCIYTDPTEFFVEYGDNTSTGRPSSVLIHGLYLTFRPVPPTTDSWNATVYGLAYPEYTVEESGSPPLEMLGPTLVARATVLNALRLGFDSIAQYWSVVMDDRLGGLRKGANEWVRGLATPRDF